MTDPVSDSAAQLKQRLTEFIRVMDDGELCIKGPLYPVAQLLWEALLAEERAGAQTVRERDTLRESLIFANELLAHHNMQVCDKHPVSFKCDAYDRCPECELAPPLCRCAHTKHSHVINNLECEICGCPEYLPVGGGE